MKVHIWQHNENESNHVGQYEVKEGVGKPVLYRSRHFATQSHRDRAYEGCRRWAKNRGYQIAGY